MTADVFAHHIAGTPKQLNERIGKRTGVKPPEYGYVISDRVPSHAPHLGTLTTARTEIITELRTTVMTMLDDVLVTVDIMRSCLLPAADAMVILS